MLHRALHHSTIVSCHNTLSGGGAPWRTTGDNDARETMEVMTLRLLGEWGLTAARRQSRDTLWRGRCRDPGAVVELRARSWPLGMKPTLRRQDDSAERCPSGLR